MATDIKLDDRNSDWVSIEASVLNAKVSDFILESAARRSNKGGQLRRALVHGQNDSLIINFNHDYPGGTEINGAIVHGAVLDGLNVKCEKQSTADLHLPKTAQIGDIKLIQGVIKGPVPGTPFTETEPGNAQLWICVGQSQITKEALWSQAQLGDPVVGTK